MRTLPRLLLALALVLCASPALAQPAYVRGAENYSAGAVSSLATGSTAVLTAGDLNVVCLGFLTLDGATVSSVTDTAGNTYSLAKATFNQGSSVHKVEIWYTLNATGHATNTVTVNLAGGTTGSVFGLVTAEYSGVATASALDATAGSGTDGALSVDSEAFTTSQSGELITTCARIHHDGATWTVPSGYTKHNATSNGVTAIADKVGSASGAVVTWGTDQSGASPTTAVATFKAAGAAGSSPRMTLMGVGP